MSAIQAIRKVLAAVGAVIGAEKDWRRPPKKRVLIYDARTGQPLLNYIDPDQAALLYLWREKLNISVLLKCILSLRPTWSGYAQQYVNMVRPSVVITMSDNARSFYDLKSACRDIIAVAIQSAWRGEQGDIFSSMGAATNGDSQRVDYVLTFNQQVGEHYQREFGGETISIGSVINNHFRRIDRVEKRHLVYISEYRARTSHQSANLRTRSGQPATWEDIYSLEKIMIPFLADYCASRGLSLVVCGSKIWDQDEERDFYALLIGAKPWKWAPRTSWYSNYAIINGAEYVVFVNSTLGYESLARGKKVACLAARGNWFQDFPSGRFGWPSELPNEGPFWTNRADIQEFGRVLDYVTSVNDKDWLNTWRRYGPALMDYDSGNSRLVALLRKLDVPVLIDTESVPSLNAIRV